MTGRRTFALVLALCGLLRLPASAVEPLAPAWIKIAEGSAAERTGSVLFYAAEFGIELPSLVGDYSDDPEATELAALIGREGSTGQWLEVEPGDEAPGDVAVFCLREGQATHVGVVLGGGVMLTTRIRIGSHLADYRRTFWRERLERFYRHHSRAAAAA